MYLSEKIGFIYLLALSIMGVIEMFQSDTVTFSNIFWLICLWAGREIICILGIFASFMSFILGLKFLSE